ncbi:MAG: FtsB family cell division protein [Pleomorphochaeta sp.]
MTIKFFQILTISTFVSYILLIVVASDIGIIQYQQIKDNIYREKKENSELEREIKDLETEIEQLKNNEQVLDLAYELGYVNTGDKIYYTESNSNETIKNSSNLTITSQINTKKSLFSGWKNYQFFLLSLLIGIAFSICYLIISKKMENK